MICRVKRREKALVLSAIMKQNSPQKDKLHIFGKFSYSADFSCLRTVFKTCKKKAFMFKQNVL